MKGVEEKEKVGSTSLVVLSPREFAWLGRGGKKIFPLFPKGKGFPSIKKLVLSMAYVSY